jgi:hypothetical protein
VPTATLSRYLATSRDPAVQVFLVLPPLLAYEIGLILFGARYRNAADALLKAPFEALGQKGILIFNTLLVVVLLLATLSLRTRRRAVGSVVLPLFMESALYALLLAPVVRAIGREFLLFAGLPGRDAFEDMVLSIGAGVYEEIVFRFCVATLVVLLVDDLLGAGRVVAGVAAVLVSGILFAAFHHVGADGEPFKLATFVFRGLAGALLTCLYLGRGLALCVYTHAIYDVLLVITS